MSSNRRVTRSRNFSNVKNDTEDLPEKIHFDDSSDKIVFTKKDKSFFNLMESTSQKAKNLHGDDMTEEERIGVLAEILEDDVDIKGKRVLYDSLEEASAKQTLYDKRIEQLLNYTGTEKTKRRSRKKKRSI